jgi:predicted lipoprotein with Yx(FWY)xxD motif
MKHSRSFILLTIGLALAFVLAACGSSTGAGPYGVSNTTSSGGQTPTTSGGCGRYCSHASTPTPATTGSTVTIKTATMSVKGKSITALVNNQGMTLYYNTSDTASSVCSGGCASAWPPVVSTSVPSPVSALPGTLSLLTDANGSQVTYNGHPLYTYSGDSAPGQVNGDGVGGVWFVAPTNLAAASGSNSNGYPKGGYPDYGS